MSFTPTLLLFLLSNYAFSTECTFSSLIVDEDTLGKLCITNDFETNGALPTDYEKAWIVPEDTALTYFPAVFHHMESREGLIIGFYAKYDETVEIRNNRLYFCGYFYYNEASRIKLYFDITNALSVYKSALEKQGEQLVAFINLLNQVQDRHSADKLALSIGEYYLFFRQSLEKTDIPFGIERYLMNEIGVDYDFIMEEMMRLVVNHYYGSERLRQIINDVHRKGSVSD